MCKKDTVKICMDVFVKTFQVIICYALILLHVNFENFCTFYFKRKLSRRFLPQIILQVFVLTYVLKGEILCYLISTSEQSTHCLNYWYVALHSSYGNCLTSKII